MNTRWVIIWMVVGRSAGLLCGGQLHGYWVISWVVVGQSVETLFERSVRTLCSVQLSGCGAISWVVIRQSVIWLYGTIRGVVWLSMCWL